MTSARNFLFGAGFEDTEQALSALSSYLGNRTDYVQFPDADAVTEDGEMLSEQADEPAAFQHYFSYFFEIEKPYYVSFLTLEQKRLYMSDLEAFIAANSDLAPGEQLALYYRTHLEYSNAETAGRLNRTQSATAEQYRRAKQKSTK